MVVWPAPRRRPGDARDSEARALAKGLSLKDSSAYNIQFLGGKPVLMDTLSFEAYREGEPWDAYRQFCQHFLAPLALMAYRDIRLSQLLRIYIDGVPLDLASQLLPRKTRFSFSLMTHIHLHASSQKRYADKVVDRRQVQRRMNRNAFIGLIDNLAGAVRKLEWKPAGTEWGAYYEVHNYSQAGLSHKQQIVDQFLDAGPARQPVGPGRQHRLLQPAGQPARDPDDGL